MGYHFQSLNYKKISIPKNNLRSLPAQTKKFQKVVTVKVFPPCDSMFYEPKATDDKSNFCDYPPNTSLLEEVSLVYKSDNVTALQAHQHRKASAVMDIQDLSENTLTCPSEGRVLGLLVHALHRVSTEQDGVCLLSKNQMQPWSTTGVNSTATELSCFKNALE